MTATQRQKDLADVNDGTIDAKDEPPSIGRGKIQAWQASWLGEQTRLLW